MLIFFFDEYFLKENSSREKIWSILENWHETICQIDYYIINLLTTDYITSRIIRSLFLLLNNPEVINTLCLYNAAQYNSSFI